VDNSTYQQRLQARMAEWAALRDEEQPGRRRNARQRRDAARARSALRWQTDADRADQQQRAARLELVASESADVEAPEQADGS
jgi:hypothetical protein